MAPATERPQPATFAPDDAFAVLGNGTRFQILQALGAADRPLSFSELRERVGTRDSGQFNYHLDKLEGHFVRSTEAGYVLNQPGRRVVEAVYSGAVTDLPELERIRIDRPCTNCGAPVEVRFRPGNVEQYCTECPGVYGNTHSSGMPEPAERGYLGRLTLPPAGFQRRTAEEVFRAAQVWGHLEVLSMANGVCPRCAAAIEHDVTVCEDHSTTDSVCEGCGNRYATMVTARCTNCIFEGRGMIGLLLYAHPEVQAFKVAHGHNLVAPSPGPNPLSNLAEEIVSVDPFEARFTYTYEGDVLQLTVDDDLSVTEVTRGTVAKSD